MSAKAVIHPKLAEHLAGYDHVVVSYADADGYPVNVATGFRVDTETGRIDIDRFEAPDVPGDGTEVELTFSHVRPQPGVGYDQRRYVNVWGPLATASGRWVVEPARTTGWDEERVPFFEYCERNVPRAHRYMEALSAERGVEIRPTLPLGWRLFLATRVPFLTATLVPVFLGAVVARAHGESAWWWVMLAFLGAACIHLGLNVVNDIYDTESGADEANVTPTPFSGGSRVLQHGLVSPGFMRALAVGFFAAGIGIGLFLAATRATEILWLGVAGVFLSIFYTAPPVKLVYRGLGDLAVAIGFGPIMVLGTYAVVTGRLDGEALYASLPVAILVMLILYVNQVPDRHGDVQAGKRTLAVRLGARAVIGGYDVAAIAAFALIALGGLTGVMPAWTLLALLPAPLAVKVHRGLVTHYEEPYGLMPAMGANIGLHALVGLLLILGYVLDVAV
ncbi:MAG TPA: prenyltransferase [Acidimicrobiia bacterium]|nr:prenyltransferase [Acidimicrobiia bacterium]